MRVFTLIWAVLLILSPAVRAAGPETMTVPVQTKVTVEGGDFREARQRSLNASFTYAVREAMAVVMPPEEMEKNADMVEKILAGRLDPFVGSYRLLSEYYDFADGSLHGVFQVTVFLDEIRREAKKSGGAVRKNELPRILVLVKEQSPGFTAAGDFLLLNSVSEEALARLFRQRGYEVVSREEVRRARQNQAAAQAIAGDSLAAVSLAKALGVDLLALGRADVRAETVADGEKIDVSVSLALRVMPDGAAVMERTEKGSGVARDVLSGSVELINSVTQAAARDIAETVQTGSWGGAAGKNG